ncbi:hypothetical protein [Oceanirhabdus sp. W0125-5]|uniref:hypothetical protein n=1 Tax=Oceanirhabdus sp. W0125-5 TaxID=2999116 RepID=UPI0022F2CAE6|nr:hypothetical protein [Oceanirhabdus sp. W0125-5]WBW96369.1 hypothetical protein OW730_22135 [Oceanirhabdus sp. W0125-5]
MRYFKEIPLWKIILLNIIVGLSMSGLLFIGCVFFFGLFSTPTINERLIGLFIFSFILFVIILSNLLLYKLQKKQPSQSIMINNKLSFLKLILLLIILIFSAGSFFLLPDLWIKLNGWWF